MQNKFQSYPDKFFAREHKALDGTTRRACYSPCEQYRYSLTSYFREPEIEDAPRILGFIMLNPSTATEEQNDPTIERIERRARAGDYEGFEIVNLFAYRATDPRKMKRAADPVGDMNDWFIEDFLMSCDTVVCGWGCHGNHKGRDAEVLKLFEKHERTPIALGWTVQGHPQHPLYIGYDQKPRERPCSESMK